MGETAVEYPPSTRQEFNRRLGDDWRNLADYLMIPAHDQRKWRQGHEPAELWQWLVDHGRLKDLSPALDGVDRDDLTELLDDSQTFDDGTDTEEPPPSSAEVVPSSPELPPDVWGRLLHSITDLLAGGADRRVALADRRLASEFRDGVAVDARLARLYARCIALGLRLQRAEVCDWTLRYDHRVPDTYYADAFRPADTRLMVNAIRSGDRLRAETVVVIAERLGHHGVRRQAQSVLTVTLASDRDADSLITVLLRWYRNGLLDRDLLSAAVQTYFAYADLDRSRVAWTGFLGQIDTTLLPDLFEVHLLVGRLIDAARTCDGRPRREIEVLRAATESSDLAQVEAALGLPGRATHTAERRMLLTHAGHLYTGAGRHQEALDCFLAAGLAELASLCYERLGRFVEALETCPSDAHERVVTLVNRCLREIETLANDGAWEQAMTDLNSLLVQVDRATGDLAAQRRVIEKSRAALMHEARLWFRTQLDLPGAGRSAYRAWSAFEEVAGDVEQAARLAEAAGDLYRANRLYVEAEMFGEADRVLSADPSTNAALLRAKAREAGGDSLGAAAHYEQADSWERAAELYSRGGRHTDAARCMLRTYPRDVIDDRLIDVLRAAGDYRELVGRCAAAVHDRSRDPVVAAEVRRLSCDPALPVALRADVEAILDRIDGHARRVFESQIQAWVAIARAEVDRRFSDTWGLDLGTSTCTVAIYDTVRGRPFLCRWRGQPHFASTLSIDRHGHELIGLTGEHLTSNGVTSHIAMTKRDIGTGRRWRVSTGATYRPEEVAARLIQHARQVVESTLSDEVRKRVAELAQEQVGDVDPEWLSWAERHHDLRIPRPRTVVTIPAYFPLKASNATRDACTIAGVELVRLIHEPTAACLATTRREKLDGGVMVVDLGAGTLDISLIDVARNAYDVRAVFGENSFGGSDFDALIVQRLVEGLRRSGIHVGESRESRHRLATAAEALKIALSSRPEAHYDLIDFHRRDHRLTLTRQDLADILREPLAELRRICTAASGLVTTRPDHLILIGGPMLSAMVAETVEGSLNLSSTLCGNPRTAVAYGAALKAATLDRDPAKRLADQPLRDVTPFSLGIATAKADGHIYTELIPRNSPIPARRSEIFTTVVDNQREVNVRVYSKALDPQLLIGRFFLPGLPRAKQGIPQIEVTFDIDTNGVLKVTARDLGLGTTRSIDIADTTLLSPHEVTAMTRLQDARVQAAELRTELNAFRGELRTLLTDAHAYTRAADLIRRQFIDRRAAHRPGADPVDARAQQELIEMFGPHAGAELLPALRTLGDVIANTERLLARLDSEEIATGADVAVLRSVLAETQQTAAVLKADLARLAVEVTHHTEWIETLTQISDREHEPIRRFRHHVAIGQFQAAIDSITPDQLTEADLDDYLRCLAETGDADSYRKIRGAALDTSDPEAIAVSLVRIRDTALGFLTGPTTVVTRHEPATATTSLAVASADRTVKARGTIRGDVVLATLDDPLPAPPMRSGPATLVRVGDEVRVLIPDTDGSGPRLLTTVVEQLHTDVGPLRIRIGRQVPPQALGGPLINELGEAIGVLVDSATAVAIDGL